MEKLLKSLLKITKFLFVISVEVYLLVKFTAYDVKAKKKVTIQNPTVVKMKNGMWAIKGVSPVTGIKVFRIVGKTKPTL